MLQSMKKNIYQILESIRMEQSRIIDLSMQGQRDIVCNLLTECQQAAIDIGEAIEREEGQGTYTVVLLEQYCEQLYRTSQTLDQMDRLIKECLELSELLQKIKESVERKIPTKYEVVFFPYKASMWDSMESVWMAAKEEPNVEAYVVPIPYFERNADHSLGVMHDESSQYPEYVPITPWKEYDVKGRHPDMIFIHNPYDNANHVTSIHPDFYSSKLKTYTDMLVYIPYFVAIDDVDEKFCILPATIHADKVILQSEKIRQKYVSCFGKWLKENDLEVLFKDYEDKFLALGSPKFDKVIKTERKDCKIPLEWKEQMVSASGKNKKIILYNTTVDAALKNSEHILRKIKEVFDTFSKNPNVLLLWRPHPLYENTLASMRPDMVEEYRELVRWYREEKIGIYDDSSDLNRAIAISDAYYGDWSSVVALYQVTGKPIMIQNPNIIK